MKHHCCTLDDFLFSGVAVWSVSHSKHILNPSSTTCIYLYKSTWIQWCIEIYTMVLNCIYVALQYTSKNTMVLLWYTSKKFLNVYVWIFILFSLYSLFTQKVHWHYLVFGHVLWKYYGILWSTLIYNVNSMLYEYDHAIAWCIWKYHITIVHDQKNMVFFQTFTMLILYNFSWTFAL